MAQENKYLGKLGLPQLIEEIKSGFAKLVHTHKLSEITDYTVDSEIKSDSENPVQNMVIKEALDLKVPIMRTVNGKSLDADINLSASDVGTMTSEEITSGLDSKANISDVAYIDIEDNENIEYEDVRPQAVELVDNLESTSTTAGLTANQGRVLKGHINELSGEVDTLSDNVDTLSNSVDTLNTNVGTLNTEVESLNTEVNELSNNLSNINMEASSVAYDDSETGLGVDNVQDAIVEQNKNLEEMNNQFDNMNTQLQTIIEALERGIAPESLSGSVTFTVGGSAQGGKHMIVFETPFASVPTVTVSSSNFRIGAYASDITKASFIINYGNSSSNTHSSTITWSAVV